MSPADLLARLVGLAVAIAGGALAWVSLFAPLAFRDGARGVDLLASGAVVSVASAGALVGAVFVLGGVAVLLGRGRSLAVSVGGVVLVCVVAVLALGVDGALGQPVAAGGVGNVGILGVGIVALGLLFAGAWIGDRSVP
ncbi:hypothetical protein [Halobellus captivus]|uniref:hypothetical protein n=1 Tax=Halobellus captivus TaxID=2592614 RepID=UPI0011A26A88|nr:hypothetical protein [Halobellus captivus]